MKDKLGCLIPVAILLAIIGWLYFSDDSGKKVDGSKKESTSEIEKKITELALKHNAFVFGVKAFKDREKLYSFELKRVLVRKDNRPVVVVASIDDIIEENGLFYVTFIEFFVEAGIRFILSSDSASAVRIMKEPIDRLNDRFAIIATVTDVAKPKLTMGANPQDEYYAEVELEASNTYVVHGKLIDFLFVKDYYGNL